MSRLTAFWNDGHQQVWRDLRTRWQLGAFFTWLSALCATLYMINTSLSTSIATSRQDPACLPNGSFKVDTPRFSLWSRSGFFQITLGFGTLTFTQAKVIDVIWDVVFGRGGQALLAFLSWRIFAMYVTTSMEVAPVTLLTYRAFFIQTGPMLDDLPRIVCEFYKRRLHSMLAMIFILTTMAFILAFPTFGSSMTGYSGNVRSFVPDRDGNFISFQSFDLIAFIVHDGSRIDKTDEYLAPWPKPISLDVPILGDDIDSSCDRSNIRYDEQLNSTCNFLRDIGNYVYDHGYDGRAQVTSTFGSYSGNAQELPSPVLNITGFYVPSSFTFPVDQNGKAATYLNKEKLEARWGWSGSTYEYNYVHDQGSCQTIESYQWGFSYVQLNLMIIFLIIWSIGIYLLWLESHTTMVRRGRYSVAGKHKAILELAAAMQTQTIGSHSLLKNPESVIRQHIKKDLRGGSISYETDIPAQLKTDELDANSDFWWLASLILFGSGTIIARFFMSLTDLGAFIYPPFFLVLISFTVGATEKSRIFILFWLGLVYVIVVSILSTLYAK